MKGRWSIAEMMKASPEYLERMYLPQYILFLFFMYSQEAELQKHDVR